MILVILGHRNNCRIYQALVFFSEIYMMKLFVSFDSSQKMLEVKKFDSCTYNTCSLYKNIIIFTIVKQ